MSDLLCYMANNVITHPAYGKSKAHLSRDGRVALCGHQEKRWQKASWKITEHIHCPRCEEKLNEILAIVPNIVLR